MRAFGLVLSIASLVALVTLPTRAAVQYPLNLTVDASGKMGATSITSKLTIKVDRPMEDSRRTRVADALQHGGDPDALKPIRPLAAVGWIASPAYTGDVRYIG